MPTSPTTTSPNIAILIDADTDDAHTRADQLATQLNLPITTSQTAANFTALLTITNTHLELRDTQSLKSPVTCDFLGGSFGHRRTGHLRGELLAKAVGYKGRPLNIIDATAGLGRDAALLALLNNNVIAIERNPILAALLQDGLDRAIASPELGPTFTNNLKLIHTDAIQHLASLTTPPHVIYLDPMFPHRKKSALVKKEMRVTRLVTGDDPDTQDLLTAALATSAHRIVVKRAPLAPPITGPTPSHTLKSKAVRYDIYIQNPSKK